MASVSSIKIPYVELCHILKVSSNRNVSSLLQHVTTKYNLNNDELEQVTEKIRRFLVTFNVKFNKSLRKHERLMQDAWINGNIEVIVKLPESTTIKRKKSWTAIERFQRECSKVQETKDRTTKTIISC